MSTTSATTEARLDAPTANLFLLLGRAFQPPDAFSKDEPRLLGEALSASDPRFAAPGLELARQWTKAVQCDTSSLLIDYARLFLGPFEIKAAPYAAMYLDPEQRLMGEISQWVARRYVEAGLAPAEGPCDAPDHIVSECEFLYFLAHQFLSTGNEIWRSQYQRFLSEHFVQWTPAFADAILTTEPLSPFYAALARFLAAFATA